MNSHQRRKARRKLVRRNKKLLESLPLCLRRSARFIALTPAQRFQELYRDEYDNHQHPMIKEDKK